VRSSERSTRNQQHPNALTSALQTPFQTAFQTVSQENANEKEIGVAKKNLQMGKKDIGIFPRETATRS